jgi:CRP-like cAMP-binding protein
LLFKSLSSLRFFSDLTRKFKTEQVTKELCKSLSIIKLDVGQSISTSGDSSIWVVLEGRLLKRIDARHARAEETLTQGDYFGLIFEKRGVAVGVEALCPSYLLSLSSDKYIEALSQFESQRTQELMELVTSIPTMKNWTKTSVLKLIRCLEVKTYLRNQTVFQEGDRAEEVYLIKRGEFKFTRLVRTTCPSTPILTGLYGPRGTSKEFLKRRTPATAQTRKVDIVILGARELFGEDEVLEGKRRQSTCVCQSGDSELVVISKADFFRRMTHPTTLGIIKTRIKSIQAFHTKHYARIIKSDAEYRASPASTSPPKTAARRSPSLTVSSSVKALHSEEKAFRMTPCAKEALLSPAKSPKKGVLVPKLRHKRTNSC